MEAGHHDALMRGAFEGAYDAVLVADPAGRIVLANPRCSEILGRDADELTGQPIELVVPQWRADPSPGRRRVTAVRGDGSELPAEVALVPVEVGDTTYTAVTIRDSSQRVHAEERNLGMIEAAPDPTLVADATGTIVLMNARVGAVLGYEKEDLVGQPLHVIVAHPPADEIVARIAAYVSDPQPLPMGYTQEFRARHRDGHEFPIEISIAPVRAGEETYLSVAVRDVRERLRMQAEGERLRDELIATVSHELRTPLTSIIGYAEMMSDLGDGDLSPRARDLLAVIERNAGRELRLVDDLLTMAFLDDNRLKLLRTPVELSAVCRRVVEDQEPIARDRGLELIFVERTLPQVSGDFYRLVQVVENLVTNALKFTPSGGRVEVHVLDRGSSGAVEVRDTGVGVSAEERNRLFDRLYRAPGAIASQTQGAGLGLPIVRAIVEAHGGWVQVESEVGVGTTFRFGIPFALDAPVPGG